MIVHRIINIITQCAIHLCTIALHIHHGPAARKVWNVTSSMPSGTGCKFILFQQNTVFPALFSKVVKRGCANNTPAYNDHLGRCWKIRHHSILLLENKFRSQATKQNCICFMNIKTCMAQRYLCLPNSIVPSINILVGRLPKSQQRPLSRGLPTDRPRHECGNYRRIQHQTHELQPKCVAYLK